jgi:hypothetical protein
MSVSFVAICFCLGLTTKLNNKLAHPSPPFNLTEHKDLNIIHAFDECSTHSPTLGIRNE